MILFKFLVVAFLIFLGYTIAADSLTDTEVAVVVLLIAAILLADYAIEAAFNGRKMIERRIDEIAEKLTDISRKIEELMRR